MLPAFATTFLFAISAVCASRTTRILGGTEANFWRVTVATLLLGAWAHTFGGGLSGRAFPYFLLSGCVGFGIGDLSLYQAFPRLGSRLCMILVHCVAAPFGALIEWCWLGTSITPFQVGCGLLTLSGIAIALAPDKRLQISRGTLAAGIFFGCVAGCGQGLGAALSRKAYQTADALGEGIHGVNGGITAAYQRIIAGWVIAALFYLVATWLKKEPNAAGGKTPCLRERLGKAWPWMLGNALAGPSIGVSCFQWALATTPTAVVLPIVALTPLTVIPLARFTEGDRPGARSILGGIIAVLGVAALTWARFHR
jgi:drug/metabolite transporter (DMT)-like permease